MQNFTPRLFLVVGNPASGKDELISAVHIIGSLHAEIVPKHTDRNWRPGDDDEMICAFVPDDNTGEMVKNDNYDLKGCDVQYTNYGNTYGIKTSYIWDQLLSGRFQVLVVSNKKALNKLKSIFGHIAVTIYVYSHFSREDYRKKEYERERTKQEQLPNYIINQEYIDMRVEAFDMAWRLYEDNFLLFDHVLIYADKQEDLFDQIFRLFRAYEKALI